MSVKQGTTLYLCLEDSQLRIQNRLFEITDDAPANVHFCTECSTLGCGLEEQLEMRGGGVLRLRQEGARVHLEAERPEDGRGLYKVWLHGDQGGKLLLGTLAPEGGRLRLRRTLTVSALERAGCWPQFRPAAVLAFSFQKEAETGWYCEQRPGALVSDPVLKGELEDRKSVV